MERGDDAEVAAAAAQAPEQIGVLGFGRDDLAAVGGDNLVKAEVVTADGRQVVASEAENPDLFWGLRGGGGNFGVVTAFHLRLHPIGPIVLGGMLMWPAPMAKDLVRFYRDFVADAPDEVGTGMAFITAPPEEFVPEPVRGQPVVGVVVLYAGDPAEGEEAFRPLR